MPIKNYSTEVDAAKTCGEITGMLAGKGARRVQIDYDDVQQPIAVAFTFPRRMKSHIVLSEVPLEFGFDLEALCGTTVTGAELVYMWDSLGMGKFESPSSLSFCRTCTEKVIDEAPLSRR